MALKVVFVAEQVVAVQAAVHEGPGVEEVVADAVVVVVIVVVFGQPRSIFSDIFTNIR
jgi:hypothetical protein